MHLLDAGRDKRVAWIQNHATLMNFEVPLLRALGLEVWTPKRLPYISESFHSKVDHTEPSTIPAEDLAKLNGHNFYEDEFSPEVADVLNRHVGTVFCPPFELVLREITTHFRGKILLRVFGLEKDKSYGQFFGNSLWRRIGEIKHRFWLAPLFDSITENEDPRLRRHAVTLRGGIPENTMKKKGTWTGGDNRLLFICPRIAISPNFYGTYYLEFKKHFGHFPHLIGGDQPQSVDDPHVAGFVPGETLDKWMRTFRVMYYHSQEPRHLHYHPVEAIVYGMPVVYLRGSVLDAKGGPDQPGACDTVSEARQKIRRILDGDDALVHAIRQKQQKILEDLTWDYNLKAWRRSFVEGVLREQVPAEPIGTSRKQRIAVILPEGYRGGTLRATKDLAKMLKWGAAQRGEPLEVVLSCPRKSYDFDTEFTDVKQAGISVRPTDWKIVRGEAKHIADLAATAPTMNLIHDAFLLPSDGGNDLLDCDLWLFVSDRLRLPVLPIRPYGALIFDYVQRYVPETFGKAGFAAQAQGLIPFAREAKFVLTTSPATRADLNSYAGVPLRKISLITPCFELLKDNDRPRMWRDDYLVWISNPTPHKNQDRVLRALKKYYDELEGRLKTLVVGPNTDLFRPRAGGAKSKVAPNVAHVRSLIHDSRSLKQNLRIEGELPDAGYVCAVKHARFLLHANLSDNGSYALVDAASFGVPSLASDYPAMKHMDELFRLNLTYFDAYSVDDMAHGLKAMENKEKPPLPDRALLEQFHWKNKAGEVCDIVLPQVRMRAENAYR